MSGKKNWENLNQLNTMKRFPLGMLGGEMVENDNISMYSTAKEFCIWYIDFEKSHLILKYKGKYSFSSSTTIDDFKKIFPKSYGLPSYIPGTPSENAVGFTIIVRRKKQKAYLNFAFYYNHLASVSVSDSYTRIIN
ncbi:MAG: hypothetical protein LBE92_13100 [Chryseobacterium sp.]|jgi:hypothetical protein|uniref:hypothetical protein n=1 Tax=Chryseobacterium sp. TaxID=1871047 RepID=UPI002829EB13|nr:hypothetical protein [Chryseobacterium sp.]MDR2237051.1 hypothetical protein [Chryseobacterium sp.]